jgi:16S rRNA (guanine966-N2)-methyltransferase
MATLKSKIKIIGGKWRNRSISFPNESTLRPTHHRIRETLFNWLAPVINEAKCLDAYAGSGTLGFEALSRGAQHCTFLDPSSNAINAIIHHQSLFNCTPSSSVYRGRCSDYLNTLTTSLSSFDIIFLDPPFSMTSSSQETLNTLCSKRLLHTNALIYIESDINTPYPSHPDCTLYKYKKTERLQYGLLQYNLPEPLSE